MQQGNLIEIEIKSNQDWWVKVPYSSFALIQLV